jgi:hypothetical protein
MLAACTTAQSYRLDWLSVNSGGESSQSSANYAARLTLAQTVAGYCESDNHCAYLGFWCPTPQSVVKVEEIESGNLPSNFNLKQNYPNPFNPITTIEFALPRSGHVRISIYNTLGRQVRVLVNEPLPAGEYRITWNGRDFRGNQVASGIYLYRLEAGDFIVTKKMVLLK